MKDQYVFSSTLAMTLTTKCSDKHCGGNAFCVELIENSRKDWRRESREEDAVIYTGEQ